MNDMTTFGYNCQWLSLLRRLVVMLAMMMMMMMSLPTAAAFLAPRPLHTFSSSTVPSTLTVTFSTLSPEEERAAALSDYLAKAHEEKLKMIQQVEMKKNQEIEELKQQIAALKKTTSSSSSESSPSSSSAVVMVNGNADAITVKALEDMTPDELRARVLQYQQVLRQYMIDAQEEKFRAVQAAQAAAQQKLTESLTLLGWTPSSSTTSITLEPSHSSAIVGSPLYAARNAAVSKAGAQSRWGPLEVQRVSGASAVAASRSVVNGAASSSSSYIAATPPPTVTTMPVNGGSVPVMSTTTTTTTVVPVPPEVAEADHGLRSDGSIGGLTLAERIYFGAQATTSDGSSSGSSVSTTSSSNPMTVLYQKRNIKVQQVAQALGGQSNRWGVQEVERVSNIVAATSSSTSGITATSSTPQRVNFGAAILGQ